MGFFAGYIGDGTAKETDKIITIHEDDSSSTKCVFSESMKCIKNLIFPVFKKFLISCLIRPSTGLSAAASTSQCGSLPRL